MSSNSSKLSSRSPSCLYIDFSNSKLSRRRNLPCRLLIRSWRRRKVEVAKKQMEVKNLKLYMKNKSIIEENEKLRKRAFLLHQENQALLFQLQALNNNININLL